MSALRWKKVAQAYPFNPLPEHPGVSSMGTPPDDATHVIWQDPSSYDPLFHGPPYLPGMGVRGDRTASSKVVTGTLAGMRLPAILVFLRALTLIHHSHHWLTKGGDFYGDHLLFERLYTETLEEVDQVGERAIGTGSPIAYLTPTAQAKQMAYLVSSLCNAPLTDSMHIDEGPNNLVRVSLEAEKKFIGCLERVTAQMETEGALSRGVDDLLAGIQDQHESHVYLLGQRDQTTAWKL